MKSESDSVAKKAVKYARSTGWARGSACSFQHVANPAVAAAYFTTTSNASTGICGEVRHKGEGAEWRRPRPHTRPLQSSLKLSI